MTLINDLLQKHKKIHFSLIDPTTQDPKEAGKIARICEKYGTHAIMVGGTTVRKKERVYETVKEIKNNVKLPIILFPNSAESVSKNFDYILFMMLLNSKEVKYKGKEQVKGAVLVKKWNIKPISTGYVVVSTSEKPTTVERFVELDIIHRNDIEKAVSYALEAEMLGMSCVYFDAGSGAQHPISNEIIREIRKNIDIPIIIGGGIRDAITANEKVNAGADVIITGTIVEENINVIKEIINKIIR